MEASRPLRTGPITATSNVPRAAPRNNSVLITVKPGTMRSVCQRASTSRAKAASSAMIRTTWELCTATPLLQLFAFIYQSQQTLSGGRQVHRTVNVLVLLGFGHLLAHLFHRQLGYLQRYKQVSRFMLLLPLHANMQNGPRRSRPLQGRGKLIALL